LKSGWYPKRQIKILDSIGIRVIIRLNTVTLDTQKSRYLQNLVKDRIIKLYPSLTKKDIRTSTTGENGADVKLPGSFSTV
jgi:hypothetical protein